ncbi:MAG: glutathione S-transferase C-terminal domain-containing protein [Burkholderiaceae bacterium]|nr:glutathione S-transferase C-terminal domain-containing protein [Burkholderiaceae bacterium]
MKLFYSPGACSIAAHIALEETKTKFDAVRIVIAEGQHRQSEFLAINPEGRLPTLSVDNEIITELMAILLFVHQRFPEANLMPRDALQFGRAASLMSFLATNVHIAFAGIWRGERFTNEQAHLPGLGTQAIDNLRQHFAAIEARLPDQGWFMATGFTLADMNLLPFYRFGWRVGLNMEDYPRYTKLVAAASERPSVINVLKREGMASFFPVTEAK